MDYLLAVDSGGSKTVFGIYMSDGKKIAEYITEGYGAAADTHENISTLSDMLNRIKNEFGIAAIAVNLGGKNTNQIQSIFQRHFNGVPTAVFRESQGRAAVRFGKSCDAAVILLAGTGAISVGCNEKSGLQTICGGWGANIGDDGSGYSIGLEAVRGCLKALDGSTKLSPLYREIAGVAMPFGADNSFDAICDMRDSVRKRFAPFDRKTIASVTKIVAEHCGQNESDSINILKNAGCQLGELVVSTSKKLEFDVTVNIAVTGGLVNIAEYWRNAFEESVRKHINVGRFIYDCNGVIKGTFEVAREIYRKGVDCL